MPTGYTAAIAEGKPVTFPEFVLTCARAFGACIDMRDDPLNAPIPQKFEPSDYHTKAHNAAAKKVKAFQTKGNDALMSEFEKDWSDKLAYHRKRVAETAEKRGRYEDMLVKVAAWNPPTPDHDELKKFMESQLRESIKFDCHDDEAPNKPTFSAWKAKKLKDLQWDVDYHAKGKREDRERAASRTKWVSDLRASLKN